MAETKPLEDSTAHGSAENRKKLVIKSKNVYIYLQERTKEKKITYLTFCNFEITIKNEMNKHNTLEIIGDPINTPPFTKNILTRLPKKSSQDGGGIVAKEPKYIIVVYMKEPGNENQKILFRGIVDSITQEKMNRNKITATSITKFLDQTKFYIDFGSKFKGSQIILACMQKFTNYFQRRYTNEDSDIFNITTHILPESKLDDFQVEDQQFFMYGETYWNFIKRFNSIKKIPVYCVGTEITFGFQAESSEETKGEVLKLKDLDNEIDEYLELGVIYKKNHIYKSTLILSTTKGTTVKYLSGSKEEIRKYLAADFGEVEKARTKLSRVFGMVEKVVPYVDFSYVDKFNYRKWSATIKKAEALDKEIIEQKKKIDKLESTQTSRSPQALNENNKSLPHEMEHASDKKKAEIKIEKEKLAKMEKDFEELHFEEAQAKVNELQKTEKSVGVMLDFDIYLKNSAAEIHKNDRNYLDIDYDENGEFSINKAKKIEFFSVEKYKFPVLMNAGFSKNILTLKFQKGEVALVLFDSILESSGILMGTVSNSNESAMLDEVIDLNVSKIQFSTKKMNILTPDMEINNNNGD